MATYNVLLQVEGWVKIGEVTAPTRQEAQKKADGDHLPHESTFAPRDAAYVLEVGKGKLFEVEHSEGTEPNNAERLTVHLTQKSDGHPNYGWSVFDFRGELPADSKHARYCVVDPGGSFVASFEYKDRAEQHMRYLRDNRPLERWWGSS